jgi:hypothetical protein
VSGLPLIPIQARRGKKDKNNETETWEYISESFVDSMGSLNQDYKSRLFYVD